MLVMGTLTVGLDGGGLGAGEIGLSLLEGDLIVAGIDLGDRRRRLHFWLSST